MSWLRDGDRNTKIFHSFASERRKMNRIFKLKREDGVVVEEEEAMKEVATNYFSNLFTSSTGTRMDELLEHVDPRVTEAMNEMLCAEFTSKEVVEALDSIGDFKAPGPDGMHSVFYKKFWDIVGEKVSDEVLSILNGGPMPSGWNDTCIVLIPKVNNPGLQEPSAKEWIAAVIDATSHAEATRIFVTMWALWHARRKIIHEGLYQPPLSTFHFVERFLQDLELVEKPPSAGKAPAAWMLASRWIPPPAGLSKVNVDAALSKNSARAAVAAVARGETGAFLGASSVVFHGMSDPETMEAMACREGMALAADILLQRFKLATDCSNVVRSLEEECMGPYGHIVREIKASVGDFQEVLFAHEGRRSNVDAHHLARSSLYLELGRHVWFFDPPEGVCRQQNTS